MANQNEVKVPEQTGSVPSTDNKAPESSTPEVKTGEVLADGSSPKDAKIPYEKFQKVLDERNLLQDMLADKVRSYVGEEPKPEPVQTFPQYQTGYMDEETKNREAWLKLIKDGDAQVKAEVQKQTEIQRKMLGDQLELADLSKKEDFPIYAPAVREYVKRNPAISFSDAYDLVKYRTEGLRKESPKVATEEVDNAQTGSNTASPKGQSLQTAADLLNAKTPDGKYKYSLSELEEMLPKG